MEWINRRAGTVLGSSLFALLGWAVAVESSMPSWYDKREDCALTLNRAEHYDIRVTSHWFPPRATCDFGDGEVLPFISTTRSVVLTILFVLFAAVALVGLYFVLRRLAVEPTGIVRSAEAVDLRARKRRHLTSGGVMTLLLLTLYTLVHVFVVFMGDIPGAAVGAVAAAVALAALGAVADRRSGPLPSTLRDSRRRGAVAGLGVFLAIVAVTWLTGDLPFLRLWAAPVGAVAYVIVVSYQWSRLRRADGGTGHRDAVEKDVLGGPRA